MISQKTEHISFALCVSALGYFVDIYDLTLFSIVRIESLKSIGILNPIDIQNEGIILLNLQMLGMLLGGILWGVLGDKKGRVSVLFGSIVLYSLANIGNAFVDSVFWYGVCRFLAGVGLAGELGAAVTLVSESMTKEQRGMGTSFIAGIGVSGAIAAFLVSQGGQDWRLAYMAGGILGLCLLLLRFKIYESGMFSAMKNSEANRGQFFILFSKDRFFKYLNCILIGVPLWFVVGVLVTFSPEICQQLEALTPVSAAHGVMYTYLGLVFGDLGSGLLSQYLKSRKYIVFLSILCTFAICSLFLNSQGKSADFYYILCFLLGISCGYWAIFITIAAEQFGTNIRATVATTVPNFVRGSVIPLTFSKKILEQHFNLIQSVWIVGCVVMLMSLFSLYFLSETFGKDLDYLET